MALKQITPTRMELTRTKRKLVTARRGHKLLGDKRDELMRRFLELAKENMSLRKKVEERIRKADQSLIIAKAEMGAEEFHTALMTPQKKIALEVRHTNVMSVDIPAYHIAPETAPVKDFVKDSSVKDSFSYGLAFTSGALDDAVAALAEILPDMLRLAEAEKACRLMADEIEKTRRRVNALEHVTIPEAQASIKYITMKLDENERSAQIRLMKVKDRMLEEAHHYSRNQDIIIAEINAAETSN